MYQLGDCGKTFVEGFGLLALEVVAWLLWKTAMAYQGAVDKRYSWNIGRPTGIGKTLVADSVASTLLVILP